MEQEEEKLEFLKREEVQTMQKDIAKLREIEAQKERERIATLKVGEEIAPPAPGKTPTAPPENLPTETEKEKKPVSLTPEPPKSPHFFKKIIVRIGAVFFILLLIGFFYWLLVIRNKAPQPEITPQNPPENATTIPGSTATTTSPTEQISVPSITERTVNWGYYVPAATRTIDTIIILSTASPGENPYSVEGVVQESKKYKVSPHYLISREGIIYRLVPDEYVAYHAGTGQMPDGSRKNTINVFSVGIELIYAQTNSPNDAQYQSLTGLIAYLKQKYGIPGANVLGHNEINPSKKTDPWNFDWEKINE